MTTKEVIKQWLIAMNVQDKWADEEAKRYSGTANNCLNDHGHRWDDVDPLTIDNCGACQLSGKYGLDTVPNYAGWARIYVEAGKPINPEWLEFEIMHNDNIAYLKALCKSINTFGIRYTTDLQESKRKLIDRD